MRCFTTIFIFSMIAGSAYAQPAAAYITLSPESSSTSKLQTTGKEVTVKATLTGESSTRRGTSLSSAKSSNDEVEERGSWRMLAASVLFMVVIALRRQPSGRS